MCQADIHDMSATDTIVWHLGGVADRRQTHKVCRHFQSNRRRWLVTRSRRGCLSVPISYDQLKSSSLGFYVPVETLLCFRPTINIVTLTNNLHFLHWLVWYSILAPAISTTFLSRHMFWFHGNKKWAQKIGHIQKLTQKPFTDNSTPGRHEERRHNLVVFWSKWNRLARWQPWSISCWA